MCGRYTLTVNNRPELLNLGLQTEDRYNITPQSEVLVLDENHCHRMIAWDYSPSWAKEPMHLINARSETLREKPSFRGAKRCVFLADGWYEWLREGGRKTPWYHYQEGAHPQGELLFFAGIYGKDSGCAIVTRAAHENISHVHHRQPVLLEPRAVDHWLEGHDLFASAITRAVSCHPVSTRVNSPRNDDPGLTVEVAENNGREGLPEENSQPQPHPGNTGDLFD